MAAYSPPMTHANYWSNRSVIRSNGGKKTDEDESGGNAMRSQLHKIQQLTAHVQSIA